MNSENISLILVTVISFFLSFTGFYVLNQRRIFHADKTISPFIIILGIFAVAAPFLAYLFQIDNDFINPFSQLELPALTAGSAIIYFTAARMSNKIIVSIILGCAAVLTLFMPGNFTLSSEIPLFLNYGIIIVLWFLFSFLFRFLNGIEAVAALHAATVCLGIFFLSLATALPHILGAAALILAAILTAFLIFNWYPARLHLNEAECTALGFLLGGLVFRAINEGAGPCLAILNMFYIIEISWALLLALILREQYADITSNTTYFQANISGLSPDNIANNILRLEIVMIVLGYFEAFAPNPYSIPALSAVITVWYLNKLKNWQTANQSFREINRNVFKEIKENFEEIKDNINNKGK